MKCKHCGEEIANDSVFCEFCGTKITKQPNTAKKYLWSAVAGLILVLLIVILTVVTKNGNSNYNNTTFVKSELPDTIIIKTGEYETPINTVAKENKARENEKTLKQTTEQDIAKPKTGHVINEEENKDTSPLRFADEMPEYVGGMDAMYSFLRKELTYPEVARINNTQGTVLLEFVIERDGSISNVRPLVSLSPECDAEAIRVVKKMPKWKPGKDKDKPVRCYFNLPIRFTLQ